VGGGLFRDPSQIAALLASVGRVPAAVILRADGSGFLCVGVGGSGQLSIGPLRMAAAKSRDCSGPIHFSRNESPGHFQGFDSSLSHGAWIPSANRAWVLLLLDRVSLELDPALCELWQWLVRDGETIAGLHAQLRESASALQTAVNEAALAREAVREVDQMKTRFFANMSHELRTPLNGIIGMAGVFNRAALDPEQSEILDTIESCAEDLLVIITDVLDFAKLDAGRLELSPVEFELNELFEASLDLFHERARLKGLQLAVEFVASDFPRLVGDVGRIRQVLINLVGNAIKFTQIGSVRLRAQLQVSAPDSVSLTMQVIDTGIGVPPECRGQLFKPFNQLTNAGQLALGGTGLGLAISRQLVGLMNGEIGLEDGPGGGSIFWFKLPVAFAAGVHERSPDRLANISRALLVQACSVSAESFVGLLAQFGLAVDQEATFAGAAEWLRRHETLRRRTVVLVDITHPEGCGLDFVLRLTATESRQLPPVVLLSDRGDTMDSIALQEAGLAACLPKPVKPARLRACLKAIDQQAGREAGGVAAVPQGDTAHFRRLHGLGTQRVLLVEDNPVNQKLALQLLARLGFCADPVGNGLEAVEALKRVHYPVVLLDCQMPVMDGWEAASLIRRLERQEFWGPDARNSYLIGLVNGQNDQDFEACQKAGMDDCITKPLRKEELKVIMGQAVARVRSAARSSVNAAAASVPP